jgi:hypothetical protein
LEDGDEKEHEAVSGEDDQSSLYDASLRQVDSNPKKEVANSQFQEQG